ncbi:hypothetical protein D3C85_1617450 [compost metagenome]
MPERLEHGPLHQPAQRRRHDEGAQERHQERRFPVAHEHVGRERAHHIELPVREIDDAHHAEHQREPHRHQQVEQADDDAVDQRLGK